MQFTFNGVNVNSVNFNNEAVNEVTVNGVPVWASSGVESYNYAMANTDMIEYETSKYIVIRKAGTPRTFDIIRKSDGQVVAQKNESDFNYYTSSWAEFDNVGTMLGKYRVIINKRETSGQPTEYAQLIIRTFDDVTLTEVEYDSVDNVIVSSASTVGTFQSMAGRECSKYHGCFIFTYHFTDTTQPLYKYFYDFSTKTITPITIVIDGVTVERAYFENLRATPLDGKLIYNYVTNNDLVRLYGRMTPLSSLNDKIAVLNKNGSVFEVNTHSITTLPSPTLTGGVYDDTYYYIAYDSVSNKIQGQKLTESNGVITAEPVEDIVEYSAATPSSVVVRNWMRNKVYAFDVGVGPLDIIKI